MRLFSYEMLALQQWRLLVTTSIYSGDSLWECTFLPLFVSVLLILHVCEGFAFLPGFSWIRGLRDEPTRPRGIHCVFCSVYLYVAAASLCRDCIVCGPQTTSLCWEVKSGPTKIHCLRTHHCNACRTGHVATHVELVMWPNLSSESFRSSSVCSLCESPH